MAELEISLESSREELSHVVNTEARNKSELEARLASVAVELEGAKFIAQQAEELLKTIADVTELKEAASSKVQSLEILLAESEGLRATLQVERIRSLGRPPTLLPFLSDSVLHWLASLFM